DCAEAIKGESAQKLFDALKKAKPDDGCKLEGVQTEGSRATVLWKKGAVVQDGIVVTPTSCAKAPTARGKVLSAAVPPSTAKACPAAVEALADVVTGDTFDARETAPEPGPNPAPEDKSRAPAPPAPARSWHSAVIAARSA